MNPVRLFRRLEEVGLRETYLRKIQRKEDVIHRLPGWLMLPQTRKSEELTLYSKANLCKISEIWLDMRNRTSVRQTRKYSTRMVQTILIWRTRSKKNNWAWLILCKRWWILDTNKRVFNSHYPNSEPGCRSLISMRNSRMLKRTTPARARSQPLNRSLWHAATKIR